MWYLIWILGILLACAITILYLIGLETTDCLLADDYQEYQQELTYSK